MNVTEGSGGGSVAVRIGAGPSAGETGVEVSVDANVDGNDVLVGTKVAVCVTDGQVV